MKTVEQLKKEVESESGSDLTMLYKRQDGVEVEIPAKTIQVAGGTKLIPKSLDPYTLYGEPLPKGLDIDDEVAALAETVLETVRRNDKFTILARYLREGQQGFVLAKNTIAKGTDQEYNEYSVAKGRPYGVVVAFLGPDDEVYLGWSKYCRAIEGVKKNGKPIPVEKLPFSKTDAIRTAVLRGIMDSVTLEPDSFRYGETDDGVMIGSDVVAALHNMAYRAEKYFKRVPANLFYFTEEEEEEG